MVSVYHNASIAAPSLLHVGDAHAMKGPYSSERSVALMIARELIKEIVKHDTQTRLPG
jgi:hypothetical protein